MNPISVYGYDASMLAGSNATSPQERDELQNTDMACRPGGGSRGFPLLELPCESRAQILSYVLPSTVHDETGTRIVWIRGATGLLATNHQIYNEGIELMYSKSTFLIHIHYDQIEFVYQFRSSLQQGLVPTRRFDFLKMFPHRIRHLMKHFVIRVKPTDSYTGMIKHNCSNLEALSLGLKKQVGRVCLALEALPEIRTLLICYDESPESTALVKRNNRSLSGPDEPSFRSLVLESFWSLQNARDITLIE